MVSPEVVVGGAVVAAVGSGLLVCLTASAAADGEKTPIEWRRTIREADGFTTPPRSCGASFILTRDISRCRASTSPGRF